MIDVDKLKKQTRKNWKREMRYAYKRIKEETEITIENATENSCCVEVKMDWRFATWLVMKKLESKGFKCEIREGHLFSRIFPNDTLVIEW